MHAASSGMWKYAAEAVTGRWSLEQPGLPITPPVIKSTPRLINTHERPCVRGLASSYRAFGAIITWIIFFEG